MPTFTPPLALLAGLTLRSSRTPPALPSALSQLFAISAPLNVSVQARPLSSFVRRYMNQGPAWVLIEESREKMTRQLIALRSPRASKFMIAKIVEQMYVDLHGSLEEKVAYKKSRDSATYKPMVDIFSDIVICGNDPFISCVYANRLLHYPDRLEIHYKLAINVKDPMNPIYELRQQTIPI